eukprot:TRINITY_DN1684_c0_g1_i1.p2 TRINITY_DN1684_c0_g1~~TRINITY_DN1684_c0_g1_i1.p2  ORF type:complete len:181 (-),score=18.31 TRINITY_DN1684_c0_g1_i1:651-1193(-)
MRQWYGRLNCDGKNQSLGRLLEVTTQDRRIDKVFKQFSTPVSKKSSLYRNSASNSNLSTMVGGRKLRLTAARSAASAKTDDATRNRSRKYCEYGKVSITEGDVDRLEDGNFLNDNLIDFYVDYLQLGMGVPAETLERFHFFNTFFYTRYAGGDKKQRDASLNRWTKINIFEKDFYCDSHQ